MHYFTEHIGDTVKLTAHLTFLERGVFALMKSYACLTEAPFPADVELLCRKLMARSVPEKKIVGDLLKEFWNLSERGWEHPEVVQKIISEYHEGREQKVSAAQRSAELRRERALNGNGATAKRPLNDRSASGQRGGNAAGNQEPRTKNQEPLPTSQAPLPAELPEAVDLREADELPPAVEFPEGFPDTEGKAVGWVRGLGANCTAPDAWIVKVWRQVIGRGFRDGADVVINHWGSYVASRWEREGEEKNKGGASFAGGYGGRGGERERAVVAARVRTHARLPEPPCEWRVVLRELCPAEEYPQLDHDGVVWGLMEPDVRRDVECECRRRGMLPEGWVQPGVPAEE